MELAQIDKMSAFDRRLLEAEKMRGNLTATSQEISDVRFQVEALEGAQENLSSAIADLCTVQQHRSLEKHHEELKQKSEQHAEDAVSMRAKVDALGMRFKRMENAVQGLEGTLELEDDTVSGDFLEDLLFVKGQVEKLHATVGGAQQSIEEIEKQMENEGTTLEQALKQVDQLADKMPLLDKKLHSQEHKIGTILESLEDHKTLLLSYDPASTPAPEGLSDEGHEALGLVKQLKSDLANANLTTTELVQLQLHHSNQLTTLAEDIRSLKSALNRVKGASAFEGVADRVEADGSVGKKELAICLQSVELLWQVVKDVGERHRAHLIAQSNDSLAEALFGNFAKPEERAVLFGEGNVPGQKKSAEPTPPSPDSKRPGVGGRPKAAAEDKQRGEDVAVVKACWGVDVNDTVHGWKPTSGVTAPWLGKGIMTATRNHKQMQAQKENKGVTIDDFKMLKMELEELNDSVDEITAKADKLSDDAAVVGKQIRSATKDVSSARSEAETSRNIAKEALAQGLPPPPFSLPSHFLSFALSRTDGSKRAICRAVARSVADGAALQTLLNDFIAKVDTEMRNKAGVDDVCVPESSSNKLAV